MIVKHLCSKLHCQKSFRLKLSPYKIGDFSIENVLFTIRANTRFAVHKSHNVPDWDQLTFPSQERFGLNETHSRAPPDAPPYYLTESVCNVVLQKSIPPQTCQLILYYY